MENTRHEVTVAMIGKYVNHADAYKSLTEALHHGGLRQRIKVNIQAIESEDLESEGLSVLEGVDAILVPGGFGERGFEGKVNAIRHARENDIPYLGICYGMQAAVVEFARNVCGIEQANSTEIDPETPDPVIGLITEWLDRSARWKPRRRSPTWVAPCGWAARDAASSRVPWFAGSTARRDHGAAPASLRIQ